MKITFCIRIGNSGVAEIERRPPGGGPHTVKTCTLHKPKRKRHDRQSAAEYECAGLRPKGTSFDKRKGAFEKPAVGDCLFRPAIQSLVNSKPFFAAKFLIKKIRVADHFSDHSALFVTNSKRFLQGLEWTVFATVTETAVKHTKCCRAEGSAAELIPVASWLRPERRWWYAANLRPYPL